ncbi:hypothetical protein AB6O49_34350 [Streptomyces sp. SBR177]
MPDHGDGFLTDTGRGPGQHCHRLRGDAEAYLGDDQAMDAARHQVVAGNGSHLYLRTLQPDIRVYVTIRLWDNPPPPPADAEGDAPLTLDSQTGILVVNQLTLGPTGEMTLPQPGLYEGTAWWSGRQSTADYYNLILQSIDDTWTPDRVTQAWAGCPTQERYVLDLSHKTPSPDDTE